MYVPLFKQLAHLCLVDSSTSFSGHALVQLKALLFFFVCVEVLWPSQSNEGMSSAVSLPNHTSEQAYSSKFLQKLITAMLVHLKVCLLFFLLLSCITEIHAWQKKKLFRKQMMTLTTFLGFFYASFNSVSVVETLSTLQSRKKGFANSIDPDEMAHTNSIIRINTVCLFYFPITLFGILFELFVYVTSLFEIMDTSKFKDRRAHFRKSGVKGLSQSKADIKCCGQ